jgi:hypothetical protein
MEQTFITFLHSQASPIIRGVLHHIQEKEINVLENVYLFTSLDQYNDA